MFKRASLKFVNRVREERGLKPLSRLPKSIPGDPTSCVFARAFSDLGADVRVLNDGAVRVWDSPSYVGDGRTGAMRWSNTDEILTPWYVEALIKLFDHGPFHAGLEGNDDPRELEIPYPVVGPEKLNPWERFDIWRKSKAAEREIAAERAQVERDARFARAEAQKRARHQREGEEALWAFQADQGTDYEAPQKTMEYVVPDVLPEAPAVTLGYPYDPEEEQLLRELART